MATASVQGERRALATERLEAELATLTAHLNAATARWLELASRLTREGAPADEPARFLAFRCGISTREAREYLRVADALAELPATQASFARDELTFTKVRASTRVATPSSEEGCSSSRTCPRPPSSSARSAPFAACRLKRRRRATSSSTSTTPSQRTGSLYLRARLPAVDGTLVVRALEAARERVHERRRAERATSAAGESEGPHQGARQFEPPRSLQVEALLELARSSLASGEEAAPEQARLVLHVDAAALAPIAPAARSSRTAPSSPPRPPAAWAATRGR